ncbi:TPA: TIGR03643 family protein [Vibrio cholerae]|nr:TIGR03643 family protein [Vibrio cholerae]
MDMNQEVESRIIEMAWEDRTPFEAIEFQFGLNESDVIRFMRSRLNSSSFKLWRKRVSGCSTKHVKLRGVDVSRGYCKTQYKHRQPLHT